MLNFFYWYGAIWSVVGGMYLLGWSDYNVAFSWDIALYFGFTIPASFILGYLTRKNFVYTRVNKDIKRRPTITLAIVAGFIAEFIICHDIPLISIGVTATSIYKDFQGIPLLHVLLISVSLYYIGYLFYLFLSTKRKTIWLEIFLIGLMYVLLFSRNCIVFASFEFIILFLADRRHYDKKRISIRSVFLLLILVAVGLYFFGILGNIRTGLSWNDTWYMNAVGLYNDSYPSFLSDQYKWAYTYITSPLANLNLNAMMDNEQLSAFNYFLTFVPDTIAKRAPGAISIDNSVQLWYLPLNACTGFINARYFGGPLGLFLSYFIESGFLYLLCKIKKSGPRKNMLYVACCVMTFGNFFFNSFQFTGLFYLLLIAFFVPSAFRMRNTHGKKDITLTGFDNGEGEGLKNA
ncbi:MAG: hypothetical protein LKF61_01740 [Eggerthellaceae bacterium]|jgi:hypothetical protein|nr:hypothetical protein [Eggerthellaceae bacterium]MCH4220670.1 hypothetical protein [Eggerthellaceae bacterium]